MKWFLNITYAALLTLLSPVILWRSLRHGRYRRGWREKLLGQLPQSSGNKPVVWFHAVSVGEVVQLTKVVNAFRDRVGASHQIVITTSTDTGFELAATRFEGCTVTWFPLDFSWAVSSAIQRIRPDLVVLFELELWPNFLNACDAAKVRTALINARMSDKSFAGYSRIQRLIRPLFQQFAVVAAQTQQYADRLQRLGAKPMVTTVTGSIKFDGVLTDRINPATQELRRLFGIADSELVFIAGSTQPPEEQMAIDAWMSLRETSPSLRLILVPRHRERFDEVADLVKDAGLTLCRRSQVDGSDVATPDAVCLLDTIGELSACWGLADIAFVGGSFGPRGGQNMLEPAAFGAAVMFGPNTSNFRDITSRLLEINGAVRVHSNTEMSSQLASLVTDEPRRIQLGQAAQQLVLQQSGALDRTIELLARQLNVSASPSESRAA